MRASGPYPPSNNDEFRDGSYPGHHESDPPPPDGGGPGKFDSLDALEEHLHEDRELLRDLHVTRSDKVEVTGGDHAPADRPSDEPAACYGLSYDDLDIGFTDFSWNQLIKKINLPRAFAEMLHEEDRSLLVRNMQHCFDRQNKYLLRLRQSDERSSPFPYQLRALLDATYNRLDNIYLIEPIRELCRWENLRLADILFDGDTLTVQLVTEQTRDLLEEVGDQVLTGISITNSDIGQTSALTVAAYYRRLVCLNGMTVSKTRKVVASKALYRDFQTRYWNTLPEFPLDDYLREMLLRFFQTAWIELTDHLETDLDRLRKQMRELKETRISFTDEASVKAHIEAMLLHSGLRVHPGISVPEIYQAYLKECEGFPESRDSALILYNALTRYASNQLTNGNTNTRRVGRGRPRRATRADNLQLSRTLTNLSWRLFPDHLKWGKVLETARREKASRMRLPEV